MVDGSNLRALALALGGAAVLSSAVTLGLPRILPSEPTVGVRVPASPQPRPVLGAPQAMAPAFDTVRLASDGSGVVAGRAEPGATVTVLSDGELSAQAKADEDGRFVAFLDLVPSGAPQELTLSDGTGRESAETVLLAPNDPSATELAPTTDVDGAGPGVGFGTVGGLSALPHAEAPGAPAAPADTARPPVLLSNAEGVRVLEPALPPNAETDVLSTVALDAIAYGAGGEVTLSGRASGEGSVRLYLDSRLAGEARVAPDGSWQIDFGRTAPGIYTLRIDEIAPDGTVASRIETPFQREEREEVAAVLAPRDGSRISVRTVQPGNTLWAIARERYGEPLMYVRVFERNRDRIRDPDLIYPGQVFVLPDAP